MKKIVISSVALSLVAYLYFAESDTETTIAVANTENSSASINKPSSHQQILIETVQTPVDSTPENIINEKLTMPPIVKFAETHHRVWQIISRPGGHAARAEQLLRTLRETTTAFCQLLSALQSGLTSSLFHRQCFLDVQRANGLG